MDNIKDGYLTEDSPVVEQPPQILVKLYRHQLAAIRRCLALEHEGNISNETNGTQINTSCGVLCDGVGRGKSLMCLSLVNHKKPIKFHDSCSFSSPTYFEVVKKANTNVKVIPITIIVVPHGVYNQWQGYIQKQTTFSMYGINGLRMMIKMNGNVFSSSDIMDAFKDIFESKYDLVLVSAMQYPNFVRCFRTVVGVRNVYVRRCIIDEVDTIKSDMSDRLPAQFTWFVSSSVNNLLNPTGGSHKIQYFNETTGAMDSRVERVTGIRSCGYIKKFFCDLKNVVPELYWPLFVKNRKEFVDSSFRLSKFVRRIIKCATPTMINILEGLVSLDVIQRLSAGDVDGAMGMYSGEMSTASNLIKTVAGSYLTQIHNLRMQRQATEGKIFGMMNHRDHMLYSIDDKIKSLEDKVQCIKERIMENDMCNICYDEPSHKTVTKCCQNVFCFPCLATWIAAGHNTCPICKKHMKEEDVVLIRDDCELPSEESENEEKCEEHVFDNSNDKPDNLKILLKKRNTEREKEGKTAKYLIFSSYDASFRNIKDVLDSLNMKSEQVKGTSSHVTSIIDRYKNGDCDILLLNARHFGAGLNLENTTDLIFYHAMDKDLEYQVIGRAHRIGRTEPLNIWNLFYESEEKDINGDIADRF